MNILTHTDLDCLDKRKKHRSTMATMRKLAQALRWEKGSFDIRSNKGGDGVSGEVTLHGENFYVQAGCMLGILVRRCNGRKDYVGERNFWFKPEELEYPEIFAQKIIKI